MNVNIEPLSGQAWARVETRVLERLANDPENERRARGAGARWPRQLERTLRWARRRFTTWLELRADEAWVIDSAPESTIRRRAEPLSTTLGAFLPLRSRRAAEQN
jgi:hypothetical protein